MVSNIFYFHPYLGKIPILTNIFQLGWNHQLVFFSFFIIQTFGKMNLIWFAHLFFRWGWNHELEDVEVLWLRLEPKISVNPTATWSPHCPETWNGKSWTVKRCDVIRVTKLVDREEMLSIPLPISSIKWSYPHLRIKHFLIEFLLIFRIPEPVLYHFTFMDPWIGIL